MSPRRSAVEARGTRERIVARGMALASVDGLEGLTIGRLAADLGMSKAGVLGHFGTKQALQLAALRGASEVFTRTVWEPVEHVEPGLPRLRALFGTWADYLETERDTFPGGCLFTTASIEFDARGGPVRDFVARLFTAWRRRLATEVSTAVEHGDLPADTDPEQVAFEVFGVFFALNQEIHLFGAADAIARTRRALDRLVAG
ncbi:MAG: TetR/AcrR family transcriptional regulator [Saccharothrix sp.]|nr:TetR/AcrR family transcriptional regulator [Saccharothrix sp.]